MKRHALLIGINEWQDKRIRPLKCAEKDAREVAIRLGRLNFQAIRLLQGSEATLSKVVQELKTLSSSLTPEDLMLVYFAGHGATGPSGDNYFLCSDALRDTLKQGERVGCLGLQQLVRVLRQQGPFHRLVITDACRDDLDAGRSGGGSAFAGAGNYRNLGLCPATEKVGHVLLSSCEDQKRALELDAYGLFTGALLQLWDEKRARREPIWINAAFRDQLGARMQELAQANRLPRDEQWPLFVEGRSLPFPLDEPVAPQSGMTGTGPAASAPMQQPLTPAASGTKGPRRLQTPVVQEDDFCGSCGKRLLTALDLAGRCQYGGCHEPICNACWNQLRHTCSGHVTKKL
jgi:hypothetical protein